MTGMAKSPKIIELVAASVDVAHNVVDLEEFSGPAPLARMIVAF